VLDHRGAAHLGKEAGPEDAAQRAPGMVGAEAEEEGGAGAVLLQQLGQPRHAFLSAAQRVDIDLDSELHC
jgi:hypothetical protein